MQDIILTRLPPASSYLVLHLHVIDYFLLLFSHLFSLSRSFAQFPESLEEQRSRGHSPATTVVSLGYPVIGTPLSLPFLAHLIPACLSRALFAAVPCGKISRHVPSTRYQIGDDTLPACLAESPLGLSGVAFDHRDASQLANKYFACRPKVSRARLGSSGLPSCSDESVNPAQVEGLHMQLGAGSHLSQPARRSLGALHHRYPQSLPIASLVCTSWWLRPFQKGRIN